MLFKNARFFLNLFNVLFVIPTKKQHTGSSFSMLTISSTNKLFGRQSNQVDIHPQELKKLTLTLASRVHQIFSTLALSIKGLILNVCITNSLFY